MCIGFKLEEGIVVTLIVLVLVVRWRWQLQIVQASQSQTRQDLTVYICWNREMEQKNTSATVNATATVN